MSAIEFAPVTQGIEFPPIETTVFQEFRVTDELR